MKNKYAIGIDIGATEIKLGLVKENGKIACKIIAPSKRFIFKEAFIDDLISQIKQLIGGNNLYRNNISGLGIGLPGIVDYKNGVVHNLTNIKGFKNVPLREIINNAFGFPVIIDNDANAFACGQLKWGAARGIKNAICVTLGSGVGGGLIIDADIYRGSEYLAGEIGHTCIDINGEKCGCGSNGCLETFVGNKYIVKRVIDKIKEGKPTILKNIVKGRLSDITPELITKAAWKNDKFSIAIWNETGTYLGVGLSSLVNVLNPQKIIIGGGISKAGKFIFTPFKKELARRAMKQHLKNLQIVKASFPDEAGIVGAASLIPRR